MHIYVPSLSCAVIDPFAGHACFASRTSWVGQVVKVRLSDFSRVGALILATGQNDVTCAVIDPSGTYAYFGTADRPGKVVKVRLSDLERVEALSLNTGEDNLACVALDPSSGNMFFGTNSDAGNVVQVAPSEPVTLSGLIHANRITLPEEG